MSGNIDGIGKASDRSVVSSNNGSVDPKKEIKLNTIFDLDSLGNNDGVVSEEDLVIALNKDASMKEKLYNFYVKVAGEYFGKPKEVGDYVITEIELPKLLTPSGFIERRKIVKDKASGNVVMTKNTTIVEEEAGLTAVMTDIQRYGKNKITKNQVAFQYNQELLENYIINEATDGAGNKITHFSSIPEIRNTPEEERTDEQKALLEEFDNFVKYSIEAGIDYGMDPKFIVSIIQQEVAFQGLSSKVYGKNGKGYMQLTSAPIKDFLGYAADKKYHSLKTNLYGTEMEELLISRGFDTSEADTSVDKEKLYSRIFEYLKSSEDPEFNIRLGTLVLRYYTDRAKGDVKIAAKNYNGSPLKELYSKNVDKYNQILQDTVPLDTIYLHRIIKQ